MTGVKNMVNEKFTCLYCDRHDKKNQCTECNEESRKEAIRKLYAGKEKEHETEEPLDQRR